MDPRISAWCAGSETMSNSNGYLQVDLGGLFIIYSVSTWASNIGYGWVTSYNLNYSVDGLSYISYEYNPLPQNFDNHFHRK